MQSEYINNNPQDKILNNGLLFNTIRKHKAPNEKQKKILKYLDRGADINASDANDKYNTPLHIAVIKAEKDIVTFLLDHGANATIKNQTGQTAVDIAQQYSKEIYDLLRLNITKKSTHKEEHKGDKKTKAVLKQSKENEQVKQQKGNSKIISELNYQKRKGTSGLSGHLYEIKLLTLILIRAELNKDLDEFYLGTNIEGLGAFDDIIFRYKRNGSQESKTIFLQAKHKDDPVNDKIKVEDLFKQNGDFCFQKYFDSYLEINKKIGSKINDVIFKGSTLTDCEFIIYTSGTENFCKKKTTEHSDEECFIETCKNGTIFQFNYDDEDMKKIVKSVIETRAVSLAKRLTKFILKENYDGVMSDEMIKYYHVFIAHNVLSQDFESKYWKFRESFLSSNEDPLLLMKQTIFTQFNNNKRSPLSENDTENKIKALSLKLPSNFGNVKFILKEKQKQQLLLSLCSKFCKLFKTAYKQESKYIVEVDESSIGEGKILQEVDLEPYLIGGLVGNLLMSDNETKLLKFNINDQSLDGDSLKLLKLLQNEEKDLGLYRLDFKIFRFPKWSLFHEEIDAKIIKDFLAKLKFYTNQAKEDQVETILKNKIQEICNLQAQTLKLKYEAILLKMLDNILKWWKQPKVAAYLNKTTQLFNETVQYVLNSPLLTTFDFIFTKNLEKLRIQFKFAAVEGLEVDTFIKGKIRISVLISDEVLFTSIKMKQFFEDNVAYTNIFLELDAITDYDLETIQNELQKSKIGILILVYRQSNSLSLAKKLIGVINAFLGKIIIITVNFDDIKKTLTENIISKCDYKIRFLDFSEDTQANIIDQGKLIFQGETLAFEKDLLKKIQPQIILNIINRKNDNRDMITIGKPLTINKEIVPFYINRSINRYIKLDLKDPDFFELNCVDDSGPVGTLRAHQDILVLSDSDKIFDETCKKYKDYGIHWFSRDLTGRYIWLKTRGEIEKLQKYVSRETRVEHTLQPETIKDVKDKVVIISAEPGMGKSTLLAHLAVKTKNKFPNMWISKINFVEHVDILSKWKKENNQISLSEAFKFLYSTIVIKALKEKKDTTKYDFAFLEKMSNQLFINSLNEVELDDESDDNMFDLDVVGIHYFNYCYNNGQLALLFDGFDEICPEFTDVVIKLLSTLKYTKLAYLCVTTRPYQDVVNQLENGLKTFSFTLQPLARYEQENLLLQIWGTPMNLDFKGFLKARSYVYTIYSEITGDFGATFTSIPLHLLMIADIFQDIFQFVYRANTNNKPIQFSDAEKDQINDISNICALYEKFVNTKFYKIRFGNQKHCMNPKDLFLFSHIWNMEKIVHKEHNDFLNIHKTIGAYTLLSNHEIPDLFSQKEIKEINEFLDSVKSGEEKTGIVECVIGNEPKFVHLTYAEYFAVEFICDKLKEASYTSSILKCLVNDVFCSRVAGMRKFFNSKMEKNPELLDFIVLNGDHSLMVLKILLSQMSLETTALHVLIKESYDNIAMFLLKCTRTAINENNLDEFICLLMKQCHGMCIFCSVVATDKVVLLNFIFDIIKHIDGLKIQNTLCCKRNHLLLAFRALRNLDMKTVLVIMNEIAPYKDFTVELFTARSEYDTLPASHVAAGMKLAIKSISHHLRELSAEQLTKIFTVQSFYGKIPAHLAAEMNNYDFFETMDNLLGREKFRSICMISDDLGYTPIMYFRQNQFSSEYFKNLIEIVYDESDIQNVKEFMFQKIILHMGISPIECSIDHPGRRLNNIIK